LIKAQEQRVI
jgi:hypothetical protein